jgi:hypothetical protein
MVLLVARAGAGFLALAALAALGFFAFLIVDFFAIVPPANVAAPFYGEK